MKNLSKQMHKHIISVCVIRNLKYLYLETRVFVKIFWDKWTWVGGGVVDPTWQEKTRQGRWIQTATALMVWLTSSYNHKGKSKVQTIKPLEFVSPSSRVREEIHFPCLAMSNFSWSPQNKKKEWNIYLHCTTLQTK